MFAQLCCRHRLICYTTSETAVLYINIYQKHTNTQTSHHISQYSRNVCVRVNELNTNRGMCSTHVFCVRLIVEWSFVWRIGSLYMSTVIASELLIYIIYIYLYILLHIEISLFIWLSTHHYRYTLSLVTWLTDSVVYLNWADIWYNFSCWLCEKKKQDRRPNQMYINAERVIFKLYHTFKFKFGHLGTITKQSNQTKIKMWLSDILLDWNTNMLINNLP